MKAKTILILLLFFFVANAIVYYVTEVSKKQKIEIVLKHKLQNLETHYKLLLQMQQKTAYVIYKSTILDSRVVATVSLANNATKKRKAELRKKLQQLVNKKHILVKGLGVLQYHFVLSNNESFYRVHKPKKLKDKIAENRHPTAGKVTVSFGITSYKDCDTIKSLLERCDDALYLAKENGRNRVEVL